MEGWIFMMDWRLIDCLHNGLPLDEDFLRCCSLELYCTLERNGQWLMDHNLYRFLIIHVALTLIIPLLILLFPKAALQV